MIPGENKYKWVHEPITVDLVYDGNRFEVQRIGEEDSELIFIPIPAFRAILKLCREQYPHMLKAETDE